MNKLAGRKQTPEHIAKRVAKLKGKKRSPEICEKFKQVRRALPSFRKGKHYPNEQGENASHWRGGKPHCKDCGKEISYGHTRCRDDFVKHTWKGQNVHIETLHQWIKCHKPKVELCECCGTKPPYDCVNISGKYLRDINDYEWLCRRCHMLKDGRLEALRKRSGKTWEMHRAKFKVAGR